MHLSVRQRQYTATGWVSEIEGGRRLATSLAAPSLPPYLPRPAGPKHFGDSRGVVLRGAHFNVTTTRLTVSLQNGTGHSPALSVSTSNSSFSAIILRNHSLASWAVRRP